MFRQSLVEFAAGRGHRDYPILSVTYSPISSVPCADFSPWLRPHVVAGNPQALEEYVWGVCEGAPLVGLGGVATGPEAQNTIRPIHLDQCRRLLRSEVTDFVEFASEEAEIDLRTALVQASLLDTDDGERTLSLADRTIIWREGGGHIINDDRLTTFVAAAMLPFSGRVLQPGELRHKASQFLWKSPVSGTQSGCLLGDTLQNLESFNPPTSVQALCNALLFVPLASRSHLVDSLNRLKPGSSYLGSLNGSTWYRTRLAGIDESESAGLLLRAGLVEPASDLTGYLLDHRKDKLVGELRKRGLVYRKAWTKANLASALLDGAEHDVATMARMSGAVQLPAKFHAAGYGLRTYFEELDRKWKIYLAFGIPKRRRS